MRSSDNSSDCRDNGNTVEISRDEYRTLRRESAVLREIREQCPLSYYIFDINGETILQSDNIERITGFTMEDALSGHIAKHAKAEDMARLMALLQEASARPGEAIEGSYALSRKDGTPIHVTTHISYRIDDSDIGGYLGISRVVDRERLLEEENRELKAQIARIQQLDAVGTLASGIAHDFNNVLQAIIGNADLVQYGRPEDPEIGKYIDGILNAGRTGQNLVAKLLTYARKRPLIHQVIDLSPCVKDALSLLNVAIPHGVQFDADIEEDAGYLFDDPIHIHQIILNLGTNAVAAVSEGGSVQITLRRGEAYTARETRIGALHSGRYAKLTVRDDGAGMDAETLARVFQPFFTTKEAGRGTGLGLAVVAGIIESQKGALEISSEPGGGTVVEVYLPLISREEALTKGIDDVIPEGKEKVAVIDDDPGVLFVAQTFLKRLGYDAVHYSSAAAFLKDVDKNGARFDAVVTDLTMPEMSGVQLARQLEHSLPGIPVILTSGFDKPLSSVAEPPSSIKFVLRKPYGANDLGRTIQRAVWGDG